MIDLKSLRENPEHFINGAKQKGVDVDIPKLIELDARKRALKSEQESLKAEQNKLAKETGPKIGQLMGKLKSASGEEKAAIEAEVEAIKSAPAALKAKIQSFDEEINAIDPQITEIHLRIPQPADADVPVGASSDDNIELSTWAPDWWDASKSFEQNKGFKPRTHIELCAMHKLVDFPRGVKIAGSRSYVLTGDGMRLHQAILRYALDTTC